MFWKRQGSHPRSPEFKLQDQPDEPLLIDFVGPVLFGGAEAVSWLPMIITGPGIRECMYEIASTDQQGPLRLECVTFRRTDLESLGRHRRVLANGQDRDLVREIRATDFVQTV